MRLFAQHSADLKRRFGIGFTDRFRRLSHNQYRSVIEPMKVMRTSFRPRQSGLLRIEITAIVMLLAALSIIVVTEFTPTQQQSVVDRPDISPPQAELAEASSPVIAADHGTPR